MRYARLGALTGIVLLSVASVSAAQSRATLAPTVRHEIIAVYLGTIGTDSLSGMVSAVREMKVDLLRQSQSAGKNFISRGVSLEPSVEAGAKHLALLGGFDEVSLGGNWTNSSVVRYLGEKIGGSRATGIPQVVLLERDVTEDPMRLQIGPEREIARYIGVQEIASWVRASAPLPR